VVLLGEGGEYGLLLPGIPEHHLVVKPSGYLKQNEKGVEEKHGAKGKGVEDARATIQ
jgi:hypothetical protein